IARKIVPIDLGMFWIYTGAAVAAALAALFGFAALAIRAQRQAWPTTPLLAMNIIAGLAAVWAFPGFDEQVKLDAAQAQPVRGFLYFFPAPSLLSVSDNNEQPSRSNVRVLEDGRELGPVHAMHADIIEKGQGRISHWHEFVGVSASDNTDPRSNG